MARMSKFHQTGLVTPPEDEASAVLHRSLHEVPDQVVSAEGIYLHLSNGRKILDATGGAAVACLGHTNEAVKQAMIDQMNTVSYCHSLFYGTPAAESLGRLLIDSTDGKMARAFIISSGSEAMEAAVKMARQYFLELKPSQPARFRFIARKHSYHGTTLGSLVVGGHVARRKLYEPMLATNVSHVSPCFAYRGLAEGESVESYVARLAQELDNEFQRIGPDTVCAFVAEPVVGAALGCVPAVPGYFQAMKAVCDKHGALLILDEVMSGMGRCGVVHAWQDEDVVPDIQTLGKGLGSGFAPVAAMLIGHKVEDVLKHGTGAFSHGQTYQGHPVVCAAAAAVIKQVARPEMMKKVQTSGKRLERALKDRLQGHPYVGDIRGKGLFWGIEFVQNNQTKQPFDPDLQVAMGVHNLGMQEPYSISIYPGSGTEDGRSGDHCLLCPPFICTEAEIDLIAEKAIAVIEDYFKTHPVISSMQNVGVCAAEESVVQQPGVEKKQDLLYQPKAGSLLPTG